MRWGYRGGQLSAFADSAGSRIALMIRVYLRVGVSRNRLRGLPALVDFPWMVPPRISVHCSHWVCSDSSVYCGQERCFQRILVSSRLPGKGHSRFPLLEIQPLAK